MEALSLETGLSTMLGMSDEIFDEIDGDKLGITDWVNDWGSVGFTLGDRDGIDEGRFNLTSIGDLIEDKLGASDKYVGTMDGIKLGEPEECVGFKLGLLFGSTVGLPDGSDDELADDIELGDSDR